MTLSFIFFILFSSHISASESFIENNCKETLIEQNPLDCDQSYRCCYQMMKNLSNQNVDTSISEGLTVSRALRDQLKLPFSNDNVIGDLKKDIQDYIAADNSNNDFIKSALSILNKTKNGKEVLDCVKKKNPNLPVKDLFQLRSVTNDNSTPQATYDPLINKIFFNKKPKGVNGIVVILHELQHACDIDHEHDNELYKAISDARNPKDSKIAIQKFESYLFANELVAYSREVKFFEEITRILPEVTCSEVTETALFKTGSSEPEVLTLAEREIRIERSLKNGKFFVHLVKRYEYKMDSIFIIDEKDEFVRGPDGGYILNQYIINYLKE